MMRGRASSLAVFVLVMGMAGCVGSGPSNAPADDASPNAGGFSDTHVFPGDYSFDKVFSQPLEPGLYEVLEPEVTRLESDADGEQIEIAVIRPDLPSGQRAPVIVFASPYILSGMSDPADLESMPGYARLAQYGPHGYAIAFVPVRGTSDAGGCSDFMGPLERADLDQAITWLGQQEWSNGNIGMIGLSYSGSTAWQVAATGNPHLKTIVPVAAVSDWFHLIYKNGTNEERGWGSIVTSYYAYYGFAEYNPADGTRSPEHTAGSMTCPAAAEGAAASLYTMQTGERDPFGFWADRNQRPGVEANYNGSIFVVTGLGDRNVDPSHSYPWVNELERQGIPVKHLMGQWEHESPEYADERPRMDYAEILLHWFDYWLKDDTTVDLGPRVQVQDNAGLWRSEDAWPPSDSTQSTFHLAPEGKLVEEDDTPTGQELVGAAGHGWFYSVDGEEICTACPAFATDAFEEPFRFAGVPKVHVTVTPTGPGGHIAAWLYIVEGGQRTPIGWGQIDLRFADGSEQSQDVEPNQPLLAKMVLEPIDVVVPAGAALELELHQGTYTDHQPSAPTYPVQLHVGGEESTFTVSSFHRGPDAFFEPPREA